MSPTDAPDLMAQFMGQGTWRERARAALIPALDALPPDPDPETLREAYESAYPFGERAHHPCAVYRDEVRRQIAARWPHLSRRKSRKRKMP